MSPLVVIPSYWDVGCQPGVLGERGTYDFTTPIDRPLPELETCLSSLEQVRGVIRVCVLLVAPPSCEESARARVESICRSHPTLDVVVVGSAEAAHVERAVARMAHHVAGETVSLRGYGAIKNMGLAVAAVFGHDVVVFLDDDEVVLSPDFLIDATWGLGALTRQNLPILAKSGFFIDELGSPYAQPSDLWTERDWSKARLFNEVMGHAQHARSRITRSNHMCGCCCAIHARAFMRVPFDPYITRGEDLDYVLDLRANGLDVWFDNRWFVRAQPPEEQAPEPSRFMQDVYRWLYEYRKLEYSRALIDLQQVKPQSLEPYPGPFLEPGLVGRIRRTAFLRSLGRPDKKAYRRAAKAAAGEASAYAEQNCSKYFEFQYVWPEAMSRLDSDKILTTALVRSCVGGADRCDRPSSSDASSSSAVSRPTIDPGMTCEIRLNIAE